MSDRSDRPSSILAAVAAGWLAVGGGTLVVGQTARPPVPAIRPAVPATRPGTPSVPPAAGRLAPPATRPAPSPTTRPAAATEVPATRPAAVARPGPEPLPSTDDLRVLFEQGKYADLLKQLPRVMVLRGKAAEPYNRYDLLMLRFETHMRMKAQAPAAATLDDALEVTDDPKKVAYCKSVDLLLKRSKGFQYTPGAHRKAKGTPIDIVEPGPRKEALKALLADEMAVVTPKVEKALDGQSLGDIAGAVQLLQGLDVLEQAAETGEDAQRMVVDLRTRGAALMAKAVQRMQARHDEIFKHANEMVRYVVNTPAFGGGAQQQVRYRQRGLESRDYKELKEIVATCEKLIPNARGLAKATGGKVKEVEDLITASEDLRRKADRTLNATYNEN